jgi:hypothetical protein
MGCVAFARADYSRNGQSVHQSRYVNPRELMALVPYWSLAEAEECAKVVSHFSRVYSNMCRDPIYGFGDYVTMSYIGILVAKKCYEGKGKRLTPFMCRGYIKSYTRKEVRQQDTLKRINLLLANGEYDWNVIFHEIEAYLSAYNPMSEKQAEKDDPENVKNDLLNHVLELAPYLYRFASDYFNMKGNERKLKKKYGDTFAKQKQRFFKLAREFKRDRDDDYCSDY